MGTRIAQTIALAAAAALLAGCGGTTEGSSGDETTTGTTTTTTTAPTETTPTTTETQPSTQPEPPTTIMIRVVDGRPVGGIYRPKVDKNDKVVLVVRSDVSDELHFHGYDISRPVAAGGTARIAFVAKIPGRFELELEERGIQLAELTVR